MPIYNPVIHDLLGWVAKGVILVISFLGYPGIVFLMIIESACIPLPSEIIMPFSGYLVSTGRFTLLGATLCGAAGNLIGSLLIYLLVRNKGYEFVEKYGRSFLISPHHLEKAESFFKKYGKFSIFLGRVLPIVRTFISLPAGIMRVSFVPFCSLTFLGSIPWCFALAYFGMILGKDWNMISPYFHKIDIPVAALLLGGIAYWLWKNRN